MKKLELFFNNLVACITFPFIDLVIMNTKETNPITRKLGDFANKMNKRYFELKGYDI